MTERYAMSDLVVIIPGITGSVLAKDGHDCWALSGRALMNAVLSLGRNINQLRLPEGFADSLPQHEGEGEPNDGVRATRLMPDLHAIPGLWSPIKGYSALARFFHSRFTVNAATEAGRAGNITEFPYDWRLSNAVSARRLAAAVVPALERWRYQSGNAEARLVLVCHSMGGLVARWFLEVLGGWELTRWLITVGTPYQGSMNALQTLVNGVSRGLGPFHKNLSALVRSFPSVYELLPTYPCFDAGGGKYQALTEVSGLGLNGKMLASAAAFHWKIAEKVRQRPERRYGIVAIKGILQPTAQSARAAAEGIETLGEYGGIDRGGDGTVPRPSAHPPEWPDEGSGYTVGASQRHTTLQETESVYAELFMRLTNRLGTWMGGEPVGMQLPDLLPAGVPLVVDVTAKESTLALTATVTPYDDGEVPVVSAQLLTNLGQGRYRTQFSALIPGTYQVTVDSAVPTNPVEPVSDVTIIWKADAV